MTIKGVIEKISGKKPKKEEEGKSDKKHHRHHSKKDIASGDKKEGHHHHHHHHKHSKPTEETPTATPLATSVQTKEISPPVVEHTVVELLNETNLEKAKHAHEIIEKRHSAELIFSGEGKDAHGLHGRLAPLHSMTVTSAGIHYLTTDEAVAKMNEQESVGKLPKMRATVETESVGKRPKNRL